ncbi:MAG: hypothetical protein GXP31_08865 [Kiritimatiellaeota bacterium]|nr:hypothetical protein [Kiritimatiellota bacterium]
MTFNEPVTGVSAANFSIDADGDQTGATLTGVTGGGTTWTVTVTTIAGDGNLSIDLNRNLGDIKDTAGNEMAAAFTSGESYTIDNSSPHADLIAPTTQSPTNGTTVSFTVHFDKPVIGFDAEDDLDIIETGTVAHTGATIAAARDGESYTVDVTGVTGDGTLAITVVVQNTTVADLAGNPLASSVTSEAVTIDHTAPAADAVAAVTSSPTSESTVRFTVHFDEPVTGFDTEDDLDIVETGTVSHTAVSIASARADQSFTVDLTGVSGEGTVQLSLVTSNPTVADLAGNPLGASVTSDPVRIESDTDGDYLPDAWERDWFGDLDETAGGDPDRDGFNNYSEWKNGTDPLDKSSFGSPPRKFNPDNGHWYQYIAFDAGQSGWQTALTECLLRGGHMVTVSDANEDAFVAASVTQSGLIPDDVVCLWLGGKYDAFEQEWIWANGEAWTYNAFASGQDDGFPEPGLGDLQNGRVGMVGPGYVGIINTVGEWLKLVKTFDGVDGFVCEWDNDGDADGDGLDDRWELVHFDNLLEAPDGDPDNDGLTNLQEQDYGTDPTQANVTYTVSVTANGGTVSRLDPDTDAVLEGPAAALEHAYPAGWTLKFRAEPAPSPYEYTVDRWVRTDQRNTVLQTGGETWTLDTLIGDLTVEVTFKCTGGAPSMGGLGSTDRNLTWAVQPRPLPAPDGKYVIEMRVNPAFHPTGVDYYFEETGETGKNSGWIQETSWQCTGLTPGETYTFRARAAARIDHADVTNDTFVASADTLDPAPPTLEILQPDGINDFPDAARNYTIKWKAAADLTTATVSFFLTGDDHSFSTLNPISMNIPWTANGETEFSLLQTPDGEYYVWGRIDDGKNPAVRVYSPGSILVSPKNPSTISCSVDLIGQPQIFFGHKVPVSAQIDPVAAGQISFVFVGPDAAQHGVGPFATNDGTKAADFVPNSVGNWTVQSYWPGNDDCTPARSGYAFFDVLRAHSELELAILRTVVPAGDRQIGGQLRIAEGNPGRVLAGEKVRITAKAPDQVEYEQEVACSDTGHFTGQVAFDQTGEWWVKAEFAGDANLTASTTEWTKVVVVAKAAYVILCQGKTVNEEGLAEHAKTLDTVYLDCKSVGIDDDDICYLRYSGVDDPDDPSFTPIARSEPSIENLRVAVEQWASQKMNDSPAPLFIVLVNHGRIGGFHMGTEVLTSRHLADMLDNLDTALTNSLAQEQDVITVLGMCHSGSFIRRLSKIGRTTVVSCDTRELSYRGPTRDSEEVRDGEFFVSTLFHELTYDRSLFDAFRTAAALARDNAVRTRVESRDPEDDWVRNPRLRFCHRISFVLNNLDGTYTYRITSRAFNVPRPMESITFELPADVVSELTDDAAESLHGWHKEIGTFGDDSEPITGLRFTPVGQGLGRIQSALEIEWFEFTLPRLLDGPIRVRVRTRNCSRDFRLPQPVYAYEPPVPSGDSNGNDDRHRNQAHVNDNSSQHPLLDDNGDGRGSHILNDEDGDGLIAKRIFLGARSNSAAGLRIVRAVQSQGLSAGSTREETIQLWAEFDTPATEMSAWIEIKPPDFTGPDSDQSMQADLGLAPIAPTSSRDIAGGCRWIWALDSATYFSGPGPYQILFYGKAAGSSVITFGKSSWVFRPSGSEAPNGFSLTTPTDSQRISREYVFQWDSSCSDLGRVRYLFQLWFDDDGRPGEIFCEGPLQETSFIALDKTVLEDGVYWWDVLAVDERGNTTRSMEQWRVIVDAANDVPAFLVGQVFDRDTHQPVAGAELRIDGGDPIELPNSAYAKAVTAGNYTLTVSAPHYETLTRDATATGGAVTTDFPLRFVGRTVELHLDRGWNLISIPVAPEDPAVSAVLADPNQRGATVNNGPVWTWNGTGYTQATTFEPFRGYWVFCLQEADIQVRGDLPQDSRCTLQRGWNLVGPSVYRQAPTAANIHPPWWTWNGRDYESPDTQSPPYDGLLRSNRGYWIFSDQEQTIDLGDE